MSASLPRSIPRLDHTGRITQLRVVRLRVDEATLAPLDALVALRRCPPHDRPAGIFAAATSSRLAPHSLRDRADRHRSTSRSAGVNLSQLAIAVLGVLVITGEYSTGMIRASFTAVPKRLPVLWAKIGVFGVVSFLLMLPCV